MSLYTRKYSEHEPPIWWINVNWKGYERIHVSAGTRKKRDAQALLATLRQLKAAGRRDLLGLIAERRLVLRDVHAALLRNPQAIMQLRAEDPSPVLGPLVDEWLIWLRSPAGISPRTQRRYRGQTIRRYEVSWNRLFALLIRGRDCTLAELTSGALANYRRERTGEKCRGQTVNRDLCAVQSLLRWAQDEKGLVFDVPKFRKIKEAAGRERWLSAAEIDAVYRASPAEWWPLFAVLIFTGVRVSEALGLRWGDVRFSDEVIAVHSGYRDLKSETSDRDVPIPAPLAAVLAAHALRVPSEPSDLVFEGVLGNYWRARRVWRLIIERAGIAYCRVHDLRHTFGVHAARGGVPLARLQRLMGHAHPHMTMRYLRHAPNSDFAADAARVAASMAPPTERELETRASLARTRLATA